MCCLVFVSCNPASRQGKDRIPPEDTSAVSAFLQDLLGLDTIAEPAARSRQLVALYTGTKPAVRARGIRRMLTRIHRLLILGGVPDSALMAMTVGMLQEPAIPERDKLDAALEVASYYTITRQSPDSAARYLELAEQHKAGMNDTLLATRYGILADLRMLQGRQREGIDARYQSIAIREKLMDSTGLRVGYINLANTYRNMGDDRKAAELLTKALPYIRKNTPDNAKALLYTSLGDALAELGKTDSALHYLAAAEALFEQGAQEPPLQFTTYAILAQIHLDAGDHARATGYYEKARILLPVLDDPETERTWIISSMMAYAYTRNVGHEMDSVKSWLAQYFNAGDLPKAENAAYALYRAARATGNLEQALQYSLLRDSIGSVMMAKDNRDYLAEAETKYETGKKALQIQLQEKEIRRKTQLNTILGLSLMVAALVAGGIILRMKLRRTRREAGLQAQFTQRLLLQTEEERSRIAAELHDSISHELLALKSDLQQPGPRIDGIINDIRRISRNLHPVMLDKIGLEASIRHLCEQLTESGAIFVTAETALPRRLSSDMELQLFRMVQESLSNAAKYAGAHAAKVNLAEHNGIVNLTVLDNGTGFDVGEKLASKDSFGLHTLLERGKVIGGKTTITSAGQGTAIHLQAPATYAKAAHHHHRG